MLNGPVHRVIFILNKKDVDLKWVTVGSPLEGNNTVVHKTDRGKISYRLHTELIILVCIIHIDCLLSLMLCDMI